ncbi:MAG: metal-dependent hydrolase [Bdellovibrionales bacterium]|nr:metal-dependent hydrolase [Bdellovibrionales bacterium]
MIKRPESVSIRPSNVKLNLTDSIPKIWNRDDYMTTYVGNALSLLFPEGESFFVDSVKYFQSKIEDPKLKEDVKGFIGQENMHSLNHITLNNYFSEHGYGWVVHFSQWYMKVTTRALRWLPKRTQLATTVGFEHMTATVSEVFFSRPDVINYQHPQIRPIFIWHCIEEIEHKDVAFNVYNLVGGHYLERVFGFFVAFLFMNFSMALFISLFAVKDLSFLNPVALIRGLWIQFGWNGFFNPIFPKSLKALKPSFHPWEEDSSEVIVFWKQKLKKLEEENALYFDKRAS